MAGIRYKRMELVNGKSLQVVIFMNLEHCYLVQVPHSNKMQLVSKTFVKDVR